MRTIITYAGALFTASLSSACCWIPLLLGSASAGTLGLGAVLEPFRPYLIGLTFAFLGMAFYFTYRPQRARDECCAVSHSDARCCAAPASHTKRFQKAALWLVTLFAAGTLLVPALPIPRSEHGSELGKAPVTASVQTVMLRVDRITCHACATAIVERLRSMPGVHRVNVNMRARRVQVDYDPERLQPSQIQAGVSQLGFPAEIVTASR